MDIEPSFETNAYLSKAGKPSVRALNWKKACASPSVKAVVPSAPASSPRSSSKAG